MGLFFSNSLPNEQRKVYSFVLCKGYRNKLLIILNKLIETSTGCRMVSEFQKDFLLVSFVSFFVGFSFLYVNYDSTEQCECLDEICSILRRKNGFCTLVDGHTKGAVDKRNVFVQKVKVNVILKITKICYKIKENLNRGTV